MLIKRLWRILGYGTIQVVLGKDKETFPNILNPLDFGKGLKDCVDTYIGNTIKFTN
jgi:hypothetical protein